MTWSLGTIRVIRAASAGGELLHLPAPAGIGNLTACGVLIGTAIIEERPATWAGVWCTACLQRMAGASS